MSFDECLFPGKEYFNEFLLNKQNFFVHIDRYITKIELIREEEKNNLWTRIIAACALLIFMCRW